MSAKRGLKMFGEEAANAIITEFTQLHNKKVFEGRHFNDMTPEEKKGALRAITVIKEKQCGKIKGRTVADGRSQCSLYEPQHTASPTVKTESLFLSCVINAIKGRDVATANIPGAFLQADMEEDVTVVFEGSEVDLLIGIDPIYSKFKYTTNSGKKLLFVKLLKAIYGTVLAAKLWFDTLSTVLKENGFIANSYNQCIMNKIINGKQCTILWHMDDLKNSHVNPKVVTSILDMLSKRFAMETAFTITRGKKHTYIGIDIDYSEKGNVKLSMKEYIQECIDEFPEDTSSPVTTLASNRLFDVDNDAIPLSEARSALFCQIVAKLLWVTKRVCPDIQLPIAFMSTRVTKSDEDDWKKLTRLLCYLHDSIDLTLTL
jgi:hypothetical protein